MNKLEVFAVFDSNGKTIVTCYFFAILSIKLKRDIKRNYFCLEIEQRTSENRIGALYKS